MEFLFLDRLQCLWRRLYGYAQPAEIEKLLTGWFSPDLYLALSACWPVHSPVFQVSAPSGFGNGTVHCGVVQPYIPAKLKWDDTRERENLKTLWQMTRFVGQTECEVLLWPEAATPWPVIGNEAMREQIELLSRELDKPILMETCCLDDQEEDRAGRTGFSESIRRTLEEYYAKRELVPFEVCAGAVRIHQKGSTAGRECLPGDAGLIPLEAVDASGKLDRWSLKISFRLWRWRACGRGVDFRGYK